MVSEYIDHILYGLPPYILYGLYGLSYSTGLPILQESLSYVKDSGDFLKKLEILAKFQKEPSWSATVVGLYLNIPHGADLEVLRKRLKGKQLGYLLKN